MFHMAKPSSTEGHSSPVSNGSRDNQVSQQKHQPGTSTASEPTPKKKRSRGRRRKPKSRNKVEPIHKKQPTSKKQHDAPMKKRDLYFSLTCAMVGIKGGASVVARVSIINWDMETVLDTFVHVPVPVTDFKDSGISPDDIRKSRTNLKAKSFSEVRQLVDQTLRGKILIGHQLTEKLTALGLTHPISDVRDTAVFFQNTDLRKLSQNLLKTDLPIDGSCDYSLSSCTTALEVYKTYRNEWEQDLIKKAQESQQQMMMQMKKAAPPTPPPSTQYNMYRSSHSQEQQRPRFPSYEMAPPMQAYPQQGGAAHRTLPHRPQQDNTEWFVRRPNYPNIQYQSQPTTAPVLSSRAMQALSSYEYSTHSSQHDSFEHAMTSSYDGSFYDYDTSTDYAGSYISDSIATASVASSSMQEEEAPAPVASTSSFLGFRFGKGKSSSVSTTSPPRVQHMSALCEEENEEEVPATDSLNHASAPYQPPRYFTNEVADINEESSKHSSSWFAFRKSKSPGAPKLEKTAPKEEEEEETGPDPLNSSRSHGCPDLATLSMEESRSNCSSPSNEKSLGLDDESLDMRATEKSSSSWFKFRRSKSPSGSKQAGDFAVEKTEVTACSDDDDWMQEVMVSKSVTFHKESSEDSLGQDASKDSSFKWKKFLRSHKPTSNQTSSRILTVDDDGETLPASSFEDDAEGWTGQVMNSPSDGWNDTISATTGGLFLPPARGRFPTESTIQSVVSEEIIEEEESLSQDLLEGMEQNLAFLNI